MSNKIYKNSICPKCDSGLKYKECCGKGVSIYPNTTMYISEGKNNPSNFEKQILELTGFYPEDFINPIQKNSNVIYVIIDESHLKDYYSIGGIVILKKEIENNKVIYSELYDLCEKYNIDYIHFTEIFGRDNLLKERKLEFLAEYEKIVKKLDMIPFTTCMTKTEIEKWIGIKDITDEQCYNALTWKLMFNILIYCIWKYGTNLIIEIWRENENITDEKRYLHQINSTNIIKKFPFANISIYKDYLIFTKTHILFSSLSDFVAYTTIKTFSKINENVPLSKIYKNNKDLLIIFKNIFKEHSYMENTKFIEILNFRVCRKVCVN